MVGFPFRDLELRANGVWDPRRKCFYPWLGSSATLVAKSGVRYFVHSCSTSVYASGIAVATYAGFRGKLHGANIDFCWVYLPAMTLATDYHAVSLACQIDVLCDVGQEVTRTISAPSGFLNIVYAEIPDDEGLP